ncbi:MAG: hypothetical protein IJ121_09255 [Eubacterium sp.]|nr:hypothetical protein [Eubacterium sp.]
MEFAKSHVLRRQTGTNVTERSTMFYGKRYSASIQDTRKMAEAETE